MNVKPLMIIVIIAVTIMLIATLTKCGAEHKPNKILKENDKYIFVREYNTSIRPENDLRSLISKHDSTTYKYKQKEVLYDGILMKAQHDPHIVIIKTTKYIDKKNITYKVTKNEKASKIFTCDQITEFEKKIGKHIVVTKTYYPKERYFYKFT